MNQILAMIDYLDHPILLIICSFLDDKDNISLTSSCYHLYLLRKWIEYGSEATLDKIKDLPYFEKFKNIKITSSSLNWYLNNVKKISTNKLVFECMFAPKNYNELPSVKCEATIHECLSKNYEIVPTKKRIFVNCDDCMHLWRMHTDRSCSIVYPRMDYDYINYTPSTLEPSGSTSYSRILYPDFALEIPSITSNSIILYPDLLPAIPYSDKI